MSALSTVGSRITFSVSPGAKTTVPLEPWKSLPAIAVPFAVVYITDIATTYATNRQEDIGCSLISVRFKMSEIDSKALPQ